MAKRTKKNVNLLDLVPRRIAGHEVDEARIVTVLMPRFGNRLLQRWLTPKFRSTYIRIKLDDIGSETWLLCDGARNVGEIAAAMRENFGERIEPCHDRLALFFKQLERARFINYANFEDCLKAART